MFLDLNKKNVKIARYNNFGILELVFSKTNVSAEVK